MKALLFVIAFIFAFCLGAALQAIDPIPWSDIPQHFNDSERIDCLERGHHEWEWVGYETDQLIRIDESTTAFLRHAWTFKCAHCYKEVVKEQHMVSGDDNLKKAFKDATGVSFSQLTHDIKPRDPNDSEYQAVLHGRGDAKDVSVSLRYNPYDLNASENVEELLTIVLIDINRQLSHIDSVVSQLELVEEEE